VTETAQEEIKYPDVAVELGNLRGPEGNAFCILGRVSCALKEAGLPDTIAAQYMTEATEGDYEHLLAVTRRWVSVR
jgi:hypothetical protein